MASRTKTHSSSLHQREDPYTHLFYNPRKITDSKPPLHTKSAYEDLFEDRLAKTLGKVKPQPDKKPKRDASSMDLDEDKSYENLKQKTQMILNDLNLMKGQSARQLEEEKTASKKNMRYQTQNPDEKPPKAAAWRLNPSFQDEKAVKKSNFARKMSDSSQESKENHSSHSNNLRGSNKKDLKQNKRDIEILSSFHEKDMEIIELRNKVSKYELEAKSIDASLRKLSDSTEKYKQEVAKLQQERVLRDKEIDYLKKFKLKLEDDVRLLKKELEMPRSTQWEQKTADFNKEIIELKEKILINNAEHRIVLTNEKDRLEGEIRNRDNIIKERNKTISELEQYKAQNVPYFEGYQNMSMKFKDLERINKEMAEENKSLKEKLEGKTAEKALQDSFIKEFRAFFMQTRVKMTEIADIGSQIFEISRQILSGEEINIDLLVGLVKPSLKSKKKPENPGANSPQDPLKASFEDLAALKEIVLQTYDKFKKNINEIYEVYVKKCGENCNIQ